MRVAVGKTLRVGPGDEVLVRGQLIKGQRLGRLYVFAKEGDGEFSPYVKNISAMVVGEDPYMYSPLSMRLVETKPVSELSFVSDIDGSLCVMQEVDTEQDVKVKVRLSRKINPQLGWKEKLSRKFNGWMYG